MNYLLSRKEHFWLLLFVAFCQAMIAAGLIMADIASAIIWGGWFTLSAIAAAVFAFNPRSVTAMHISAVGLVCGTVARGSWLLLTLDTADTKGLVMIRASLYLLVGILAFLVWVRLLAPNNGAARAEDRRSVIQ